MKSVNRAKFLFIFCLGLSLGITSSIYTSQLDSNNSIVRSPASEQESKICENEKTIDDLKKQLKSIEDQKQEIQKSLDKLTEKESEDSLSDEDIFSPTIYSALMFSALLNQQRAQYPMIRYSNDPTVSNMSTSDMFQYLYLVRMQQEHFQQKWSGTWSPVFHNGERINYQYGMGINTNKFIENMYRGQ